MVLPVCKQSLARRQHAIVVLRVKSFRKKLRPIEPGRDGVSQQPAARLAHESELEGLGITLPDHAIEAPQQLFGVDSR